MLFRIVYNRTKEFVIKEEENGQLETSIIIPKYYIHTI